MFRVCSVVRGAKDKRSYGRQADEIQLDFGIFKILYRLSYLEFYFFDISAMLLILLEVCFSLLFANKAYFRMRFVVCKILSPFFHVDPYCWVLVYLMIKNWWIVEKKLRSFWDFHEEYTFTAVMTGMTFN